MSRHPRASGESRGLVVEVARGPIEEIARRSASAWGWALPWVSSYKGDFKTTFKCRSRPRSLRKPEAPSTISKGVNPGSRISRVIASFTKTKRADFSYLLRLRAQAAKHSSEIYRPGLLRRASERTVPSYHSLTMGCAAPESVYGQRAGW